MISGEPDSHIPNDNFGILSEQEITQNANLIGNQPIFNPVGAMSGYPNNGGYFYDPNARMNMMYQQNPMNSPPSGFGTYMNQPGVSGFVGNPAFQMMGQMGMNPYYPPQQDRIEYYPGYSTGGTMLLPSDAYQRCEELQLQMMMEQEEAYRKRMQNRNNYFNQTGLDPNYYGQTMFQPSEDWAIVSKYRQMIEDMRQDAIEARTALNKNLSRLAHRIGYGEDIDETQLNDIYEGRMVTIPAQNVQFEQHQAMLESMTPCDNSAMYNSYFASIKQEHDQYFGGQQNVSMNQYFRNVGVMMMYETINKEREKRKDGSALYAQDGSYRALLLQKKRERQAKEDGDMSSILQKDSNGIFQMPTLDMRNFPILNNFGNMMDDGTIVVSPSFGGGDPHTIITNEKEQNYDRGKSLFVQSIYRDNPRPGGG